jgi:hypothetical protein
MEAAIAGPRQAALETQMTHLDQRSLDRVAPERLDMSIDAGLRRFMIGVYNKVALGLVLSAGLAYLTSKARRFGMRCSGRPRTAIRRVALARLGRTRRAHPADSHGDCTSPIPPISLKQASDDRRRRTICIYIVDIDRDRCRSFRLCRAEAARR